MDKNPATWTNTCTLQNRLHMTKSTAKSYIKVFQHLTHMGKCMATAYTHRHIVASYIQDQKYCTLSYTWIKVLNI